MNHALPNILSAGLFRSETHFPNLSVTRSRDVDCYELEFFFENGGISVLNGKEYPIQKSHVLFAKPGDVRYSHLPFTCRFLHFTVSDPAIIAVLESISPVFPVADPKKTEEQFSSVIRHFYSANLFDNLRACAELICLLHQLSEEKDKVLNTITKAQQFIESNYPERLTIHSIAQACNISSSYLHKLFCTTLGTTPGEYLLHCRICAAKDLLANTNLPLCEIAFRCGFNSQSYFSDCFKRTVGNTPLSFRKKAGYML